MHVQGAVHVVYFRYKVSLLYLIFGIIKVFL